MTTITNITIMIPCYAKNTAGVLAPIVVAGTHLHVTDVSSKLTKFLVASGANQQYVFNMEHVSQNYDITSMSMIMLDAQVNTLSTSFNNVAEMARQMIMFGAYKWSKHITDMFMKQAFLAETRSVVSNITVNYSQAVAKTIIYIRGYRARNNKKIVDIATTSVDTDAFGHYLRSLPQQDQDEYLAVDAIVTEIIRACM